MSNYHSSDTFQQLGTTESNGYNLFPGAYMSKGVGGKRRSKSLKEDKNKKDKKKGGDCGCSKIMNPSSNLFGGKRTKRSMKNKKNKKNKTKKDKW
jgi:hypothetical protein